MIIDGVEVCGVSEEDARMLVETGRARYADLKRIDAGYDGEFINARFHYGDRVPFERIARITGYLVGTENRWNDAKRAELHDRVKHAAPKF